MNRVLSGVFLVLLGGLSFTACGGGSKSKSDNTKPLTNLKDRLFVSNAQQGVVQIVDADKDQLAGRDNGLTSTYNISISGSPEFMDSTPDNKTIALFDAAFNSVAVVSSDIEDRIAKVGLGGVSDSIRITSDGKFVYAAVRNRNNGTGVAPGAVQVADVTNNVLSATYPVPNARWMALSHNDKTLLVFPDDASNTPYIIDLSVTSPAAVPIPPPNGGIGFDRPIAAYFSSDDSKVYILNCGAECGGAVASVTPVTISGLVVGTSVPVPAATVGALDGTTLYVAGQTAAGGVASVVDTAAMTVSSSAAIGQGFHTIMRVQSSKVWIGASNCGGGGCLSVLDPTSGSVVVDNPASGSPSKGNVTGMDFNTTKSLMYVCEGGELNPYDTSGNPVTTLVDIIGTAWDVRSVPPITK